MHNSQWNGPEKRNSIIQLSVEKSMGILSFSPEELAKGNIQGLEVVIIAGKNTGKEVTRLWFDAARSG